MDSLLTFSWILSGIVVLSYRSLYSRWRMKELRNRGRFHFCNLHAFEIRSLERLKSMELVAWETSFILSMFLEQNPTRILEGKLTEIYFLSPVLKLGSL